MTKEQTLVRKQSLINFIISNFWNDDPEIGAAVASAIAEFDAINKAELAEASLDRLETKKLLDLFAST